MLLKRTIECPEFVAGDRCRLREVLHPRNDGGGMPFSLAQASVAPGEATLPHRLASHEAYYILAGAGRMHVDDEARAVAPGDAILIPPGAEQWIENPGVETLQFIAIVGPPWRAQDEVVG